MAKQSERMLLWLSTIRNQCKISKVVIESKFEALQFVFNLFFGLHQFRACLKWRKQRPMQTSTKNSDKINEHNKRFECTETNIAIYGGDQIQ